MALRLRHPDSLRWLIIPIFIGCLLLVEAAAWLIAVKLPSDFDLNLLGRSFEVKSFARKFMAIGFASHLILPATFALEWTLVGWHDCSIRKILVRPSRSTLSDISVYFTVATRIFRFLSIPLSFGIVLISGDGIRQFLEDLTNVSLDVSSLPIWAQVIPLFILYTFFDYWSHRADHSPTFWPLHRYHHAAEDFCVLTSDRVHPAAFTDIIVACSTILVGGSATAFAIMYALISTLRHVIHSGIGADFGWVGRYLIQSPRHHRQHHALDITGGVGNFSLFPLWDRLFGTWREAPQADCVIGVATPYRQGGWIGADMWRDYTEFWSGLASSLTKLIPSDRRSTPSGLT